AHPAGRRRDRGARIGHVRHRQEHAALCARRRRHDQRGRAPLQRPFRRRRGQGACQDRPAGGEAGRQADAAAVSSAWKVVVAEGAQLTLEELARQIGAEVRGDRTRRVRGVAGLAEAGPEEVAFFANPRYRAELKRTRAAAVILSEDEAELAPEGAARLIAPQPYVAFAKASALF